MTILDLAPRKGFLRLCAALALLAPPVLTRAAEPPKDDPKPTWRNGPVRYLLTDEEDRSFKALKTDEERAKAIDEFWARRDPTPGSPSNEFRIDYFLRVDDANKQFRETTSPGWATERGRVLLTAGYPKERKPTDEEEIWAYEMLAGLDTLWAAADEAATKAAAPAPSADALEARKNLKRVLTSSQKVSFEKNDNGDFALAQGGEIVNAIRKLSQRDGALVSMPHDPALAVLKSAGAPKSAAAGGAAAAGAAGAVKAGAPGGAAPGAAAAAPAAPTLAPGVDRLKQAALGAEPKSEIGMAVSVRYFKAGDGSTRTVVMVALKKSDIGAGADGKPKAILYARFLPDGAADATPVEFLEQDLFSAYDDQGEGWLKYAFAWALKKKTYELRVAASDGPDGKIATDTEMLTLPDFKTDELAMSSVTIAKASFPAPAAADPASPDSFVVGTQRLIPWVKPMLGPKDDLSLYYDVYNAKTDSASGKPSLDAAYLIEKKEPAGWKRRGRAPDPDKHEESLGYTIPAEAISQWPAGQYRLTVQIKDKIANVDKSSSVEFSIVK